ncbi:hypothetical protein ACN38_g13228 [Penicillium nordicum]|uniref:Retrotransposon gag domain-containing protein n=1 Tax=Penicillium nordicum TaxID=229535 RepID=A0A0M8NNG1_9EURO|nr:hypothetical protein ACN38_g13228 [Penicillium nordicum]
MDQNQPPFTLIQQLQQQLLDQQQQLEALAPARTQFRLPDPPRFDGKPLNLKTWLPAIRAKLRSDNLVGQQAFDYVYDRLEHSQQASILHLRETDPTPEAVFQYFERLYHNPREKQDVLLRFANIRQKDDESLLTYLARFERFSHEAKVHQQDLLRTITLHRGLRATLRQTLEQSYDTLFDLKYDEYVELLQRYDRRQPRPFIPDQNQITQNQTRQNPISQNQPRQNQITQNQTRQNPISQNQPRQNQINQNQSDPMDLDPIRMNTARIQIQPVKTQPKPDLARTRSSSPQKPVRSTSPPYKLRRTYDKQAERTRLGLCFYCGSPAHWIADCLSRPPGSSRCTSPLQTPDDPDSSPFWNSDGYDSDDP